MIYLVYQITELDILIISKFNHKTVRWGGGERQEPPPCGFSKNVFSEETMKPCFFVTFNIIIPHIFLVNFIEVPHVAQKV